MLLFRSSNFWHRAGHTLSLALWRTFMTFHNECMYVNTVIAGGNYSGFIRYKNIGYKGIHIQYPCVILHYNCIRGNESMVKCKSITSVAVSLNKSNETDWVSVTVNSMQLYYHSQTCYQKTDQNWNWTREPTLPVKHLLCFRYLRVAVLAVHIEILSLRPQSRTECSPWVIDAHFKFSCQTVWVGGGVAIIAKAGVREVGCGCQCQLTH